MQSSVAQADFLHHVSITPVITGWAGDYQIIHGRFTGSGVNHDVIILKPHDL
jgi:hypothetical protein